MVFSKLLFQICLILTAALQVLCNGGMAMELSLLYLLDIGSLELPVDFRNSYRASWLGKKELSQLYLLDIGSLELPVDFRNSYLSSWLGKRAVPPLPVGYWLT